MPVRFLTPEEVDDLSKVDYAKKDLLRSGHRGLFGDLGMPGVGEVAARVSDPLNFYPSARSVGAQIGETAAGTLGRIVPTAAQPYLKQAGEALEQVPRYVNPLARTAGGALQEIANPDEAHRWSQAYERAAQELDKEKTPAVQTPQRLGRALATSIIPQVAIGRVTGGSVAPIAYGSAITGSQALEESGGDIGYAARQAAAEAIPAALMSAAGRFVPGLGGVESIGARRAVGTLAQEGRRALGAVAGEASEETATALMQGIDRQRTLGIPITGQEVGEAALLGALGGGVISAPALGAAAIGDQAQAREIRVRKAEQAAKQAVRAARSFGDTSGLESWLQDPPLSREAWKASGLPTEPGRSAESRQAYIDTLRQELNIPEPPVYGPETKPPRKYRTQTEWVPEYPGDKPASGNIAITSPTQPATGTAEELTRVDRPVVTLNQRAKSVWDGGNAAARSAFLGEAVADRTEWESLTPQQQAKVRTRLGITKENVDRIEAEVRSRFPVPEPPITQEQPSATAPQIEGPRQEVTPQEIPQQEERPEVPVGVRILERQTALEALPAKELNDLARQYNPKIRGWRRAAQIQLVLDNEFKELEGASPIRSDVPEVPQVGPVQEGGQDQGGQNIQLPEGTERPTPTPPEERPPIPRLLGRTPVTRQQVARAFPGTTIIKTPKGYQVEAGDSFFNVDFVEKVPVTRQALAQRLGRAPSNYELTKFIARGSFGITTNDGTRHEGLGLIRMAYGLSDDSTLRHEALHLARQAGFLTPQEWGILSQKYGKEGMRDTDIEEAVAAAKETWRDNSTLWQRLKSWIRRILAGFGYDRRTADDIHKAMTESDFWQRKASRPKTFFEQVAGEEAGESFAEAKKPPHTRANLGVTAAARGLIDIATAAMPERPSVTMEQLRKEAAQRLEEDAPKERKHLLQMARQGAVLNGVQITMAKHFLNQESVEALASMNPEKLLDLMHLSQAVTRLGSEWGLAGRAMHDPVENPKQRFQRMLTQAVIEPPPRIKNVMKLALSSKNVEGYVNAMKEWAAEMPAFKQKLADLGLDIDNMPVYDKFAAAAALREMQALKAPAADKVYEFWRNGIMSAVPTQAANMVGNMGHGAVHFTANKLVEATWNTATLNKAGFNFADMADMYKAGLASLPLAMRNFFATFDLEVPHFAMQRGREGKSRFEIPAVSIAGRKGRVIRLPQRLLLAADDLAETIFAHLEAGAIASQMAREEGLKGADKTQRVADLMADVESAPWMAAYNVAEELTYKQQGSLLTQRVKALALRGRKDLSILGARYILPFINTPANIYELAVKKGPLGAVGIPVSAAKIMYANHLKGDPIFKGVNQKVAPQIAQQLIAWAVLLTVMDNDDEDPWITGTESEWTRGGREMARRQGRLPQAINMYALRRKYGLPAPEGDYWVSYARVEPFATILATTADVAHRVANGEFGGAAMATLRSQKHQLTEKTFLSGLGDVARIFENEDWLSRGPARYVTNFAVSWVPNIIRRTGRAADETMTQQGIWGDEVQWKNMLYKRMVQRSEVVPDAGVEAIFGEGAQPLYDLWGREVPASVSFVPFTDFLWRATVPADTRVDTILVGDRIMLNWNNQNPDKPLYGLPPQKKFRRNKQDIWFSDAQYAEFSRKSGELARKAVESAKWDSVEEPTQKDIDRLKKIISRSRDKVKSEMYQGGEFEDQVVE